MPKNVQLPDGRVVAFPDTMSDDDVSSAISKDLAASAPSQHPVLDAVKDFGKGVLKSGISTMSAADDFAQKHLPAFMTTPIGQAPTAENSARAVEAAKQMATPNGTAQSIGKGIGNAAQFLIPGAAEEAGASMLAPTIGKLAARMTTGAIGSGAVNSAQGGGFIPGAIAGAAGPAIAKGLKSVAPVIAEKALGVRAVDRAYGRTPGDAIMNETTGLKPGTIADNANSKISQLTSELEDNAANSHLPGAYASMVPAREAASSGLGTAVNENNPHLMKEMGALSNQLAHPLDASGKPIMEELNPLFSTDPVARRFTPLKTIPDMVPPGQILSLKRGIGALKNSWNPATVSDLANSTIGRAYGAMDGELDRTVPGAKALNDRISTLLPVANRAGATDLNEGLIGRTIGRFGKPTGALVGGLAGAAEGRREGGTQGAIIGGLTGLVAPEILSNPATLMTGARAMYSPITGKLLPAAAGLGLQLGRK